MTPEQVALNRLLNVMTVLMVVEIYAAAITAWAVHPLAALIFVCSAVKTGVLMTNAERIGREVATR